MLNQKRVMHCVDDEVVTVDREHDAVAARVRVWRVKGEPAVVLVNHIAGQKPPSFVACQIAKRVLRDMLGYSPLGMIYFEFDEEMLFQVQFNSVGISERMHFVKPGYRSFSLAAFNTLVGDAIFGSRKAEAA